MKPLQTANCKLKKTRKKNINKNLEKMKKKKRKKPLEMNDNAVDE